MSARPSGPQSLRGHRSHPAGEAIRTRICGLHVWHSDIWQNQENDTYPVPTLGLNVYDHSNVGYADGRVCVDADTNQVSSEEADFNAVRRGDPSYIGPSPGVPKPYIPKPSTPKL